MTIWMSNETMLEEPNNDPSFTIRREKSETWANLLLDTYKVVQGMSTGFARS